MVCVQPLPPSNSSFRRYNDWEWAVADFAIVRAGLVPVGVHGTYQHHEALSVLRKAEAKALVAMSDIFASRGTLWSVRKVVQVLAPEKGLGLVIGADLSLAQVQKHLQGVDVGTASFLQWVMPPQKVNDPASALTCT